MIKINDKSQCCGCNACVQRCPKLCIEMREDEEGFLYPKVDTTVCIDCGLCEKVCPVINQADACKPLQVYAAKNTDEEIRKNSSSGGVFSALAERTINEGGVVFGARFDENWEVKHDYAETVDGVVVFRGSKYVQSKIGDTFMQAEQFLKQGRKVLFSGTPCQIVALKKYLKKEYENLLLVDFICHGVPSPGVWREYLKWIIAHQCDKNSVSSHPKPLLSERNALVEGISFRDKRLGWQKYSFALTLSTTNGSGNKNTVLLSEPLNQNLFMRGFLANLYLRPSCYACPANKGKSGSDITLGDWWGIASLMPDYDDDKGVSAIAINTEKGQAVYATLNVDNRPTAYEALCQRNPSMIRACAIPKNRKKFFALWKTMDFDWLIIKLTKKSLKDRIKSKVMRTTGAILGTTGKKTIKKLLGR